LYWTLSVNTFILVLSTNRKLQHLTLQHWLLQ